jgi:hypothetical protein
MRNAPGVTGAPAKVIEDRVYQAIAAACSRVRGVVESLISTSLALAACAETTPVLGRAESADQASAPLARVTFTSRRSRSLDLDDRLPLFDRVGFSWPSAILHDREHDVYWVSNLNLDRPRGAAFISRLQPDGSLSTLNFIDGARPGVQLRSPHGLAVSGESLLVADVDAIRTFDARSGAPGDSILVPDSRYLSDVAVAADGSIYVTDVGGDPNLAALPNEGADAVYKISSGEVSVVARRPDLGGPFALLTDGTGLWVACTGSADLLLLIPGAEGTQSTDAGRLRMPGEMLRGIASMPDGTFLISSWSARAVYRGFRDGPFQPVISGLESPADLDYDIRRKRLLIPLLSGQALAIFELEPISPAAPRR